MKKNSRLVVLFVGLTLIAGAWLHLASRTQAKGESAKPIKIAFKEFKLKNGLRVIMAEDHSAPTYSIDVTYNAGSRDERKGRTGFAHLFEHIGLFNGTENYPKGLMEPLRALGATDWNGTTWYDRTNYFQTVPTPALEQALHMESDRMGHLLGALTQERLDNQRGVVQNEKRQGDNQPFGLVGYAQAEALFPEGHPYRHDTIGSMADLDAASLEDVRRWFREKYGPNNAVLVLAGDVDAATARRLVEKYFGHIPRGPANNPAAAAVPTLAAPVVQRMTDRVANTRLYRTWAVPGLLDPDSAAVDVAADILGGLASSRLDRELVRGDKSAVQVSGFYLPFQRVGTLELNVDVKPGGDADAVAARLDSIVRDFIANGPSAEEVERAVTRGVAQRIRALEQVGGFGGKAVVLAEGTLYANDPGFYRRQLDAYARITPASVQAAARKWLARPAHVLRVDPGERAPYQEAAGGGAAPAAAATAASGAAPVIVPRAPPPPVGNVANLDFPDIERATLSNGIPVTYARRQAIPSVQVAVEFDAGIAADPADALGTQALVLNLLTQGTTSRDANRIAEEQERLGAIVGAGQSLDRTTVTLAALTPNLAPSLDLLADIVRNPAFAPAEVERLRAQRLALIANERTTPIGMAQRVLGPALYGASYPYGRPLTGTGDPAVVGKLSRADLVAFHQAWLRPDNAHIYAVGDIPLAELVPMLEARFGTWHASATPKGTKSFAAAPPPTKSRILLIDRPQSPQSMIAAGSVLPLKGSDDVLSLLAANEVLSSGFLARINQDIRETRGWSYGVQGQLQLLENRIPLLIFAPVQTNQTGPSIQAILDQVRAFTTDKGVTPAELQRVIAGNTRQLAGSFETSGQVLNALRTNDLLHRRDDFYETVAGRYRAMDQAALDAAARAAIDPAAMLFVVVGDASVIRPQLQALGLPLEEVALQ
jgi:predicted Zn-dependent peptidase